MLTKEARKIWSQPKYDSLQVHGFKRGWLLKQKSIFGWSNVSKSEEHKTNKLHRFFNENSVNIIEVQDFRAKVFDIFGGNEFCRI